MTAKATHEELENPPFDGPVSPGAQEQMTMEPEEKISSCLLDVPTCMPKEMELAKHLPAVARKSILKTEYGCTSKCEARKHEHRGIRHAE